MAVQVPDAYINVDGARCGTGGVGHKRTAQPHALLTSHFFFSNVVAGQHAHTTPTHAPLPTRILYTPTRFTPPHPPRTATAPRTYCHRATDGRCLHAHACSTRTHLPYRFAQLCTGGRAHRTPPPYSATPALPPYRATLTPHSLNSHTHLLPAAAPPPPLRHLATFPTMASCRRCLRATFAAEDGRRALPPCPPHHRTAARRRRHLPHTPVHTHTLPARAHFTAHRLLFARAAPPTSSRPAARAPTASHLLLLTTHTLPP